MWGMMGGMPPWMMGKGMMGKGKGKKGGGGKGKKGEDGENKGQVKRRVAMGETLYNGTIKNYIPDKKHGYIVCDDIGWTCSSDVYAYEDVLQRGKAGPGDFVVFFVHWSPKGQPQASSPLLRLAKYEDFALKGTYKPMEGKDFGFIDCEETKEFFGRDVYVHKDMAPSCTPGETYRFNVSLNKDGMPQVKNIEQCEPDWEPTDSDLTQETKLDLGDGNNGVKGGGKGKDGGGWGGGWDDPWTSMMKGMMGMMMMSYGFKGKGKGKGKSKGAAAGALTSGDKATATTVTPTGESYTGTVTTATSISSTEVTAAYGTDALAMDLGGCSVGETVSFEVGIDEAGVPHATNVTSTGGPAKKQKTL